MLLAGKLGMRGGRGGGGRGSWLMHELCDPISGPGIEKSWPTAIMFVP